MPRHFNRTAYDNETPRERQDRRVSARNAYAHYLQDEEVSFDYIPECWERLNALGRLSHSWQDYYGHGIDTSMGFSGSNDGLAIQFYYILAFQLYRRTPVPH